MYLTRVYLSFANIFNVNRFALLLSCKIVTFYETISGSNDRKKKALENILGKAEYARNQVSSVSHNVFNPFICGTCSLSSEFGFHMK